MKALSILRRNKIVIGLVSLNLLLSFSSSAQNCKEIIGYYPNWQWYDRNKLVNPQTIDYSKYTVINYCFFAPQANGTISLTDPWADENLLLGQINWSSGGYYPNTSIVDLAHNNGVKVLPSIGGWTLSGHFPSIAADPVKRNTFVQSCVQLVQTYNFDGIDLDWEYPGYAPHNGTVNDKQNFNLLLQQLRSALDAYGASINRPMLLTAAVGAAPSHMQHVDWPVAAQYLDMINLMSYDFFGAWDGNTNHNAPLCAPQQGDDQFNVSAAIANLIDVHGVSPQKINGGVAFYGRSQKTPGVPVLHGPGTGMADEITFQADEGTPLYYNTLLKMNLFDQYWDTLAGVPYLVGKNGLHTFLSYDDEQSIQLKAQHFVDRGILGAIIWEITGDYIETSQGSGLVASTPLVDKLNQVFCNYQAGNGTTPCSTTSGGGNSGGSVGVSNNIEAAFYVFPNPADDIIVVQGGYTGNAEIQIFDASGRCVLTTIFNGSGQKGLSVSQLATGYYVMRITANGLEKNVRLVIAR